MGNSVLIFKHLIGNLCVFPIQTGAA